MGSSPESLASILTNKAPLLNTPGSDLGDPLYYGKYNSTVSAAEAQFYFGKDRIDFQGSKSLTSQQNVYIPNRYFAGNVFLNLQLQGDQLKWLSSGLNALEPFFILEQGWGFSVIQTLTYYLGASSVANVSISGESNLAMALAACETNRKRQAILNGAGLFLFSRPTTSSSPNGLINFANICPPAQNQYLFRSNTNIITDVDVGDYWDNTPSPALLHALVPLRMPWASTCRLQGRLPFDTNLLNQPINVQIQFRRPPVRTKDAFFQTNNAFTTITSFAQDMNLQYEQVELIDKSLSLRDELLAQPDYNVGLPFQFTQSMSFPARHTLNLGLSNNPVNITSMLNADLTTIYLALKEPTNEQQYGNNSDFVELNNLTLSLNGQQFSVFEVSNYYPVSAIRAIDDATVDNHTVMFRDAGSNADSDAFSDGAYIYKQIGIYEINMSLLRAIMNESHLVNTPRFTNQTFQVRFTIPKSIASRAFFYEDDDAEVAYQLYTTYCYNSVFQIGGSGGTSTLYTT